MTNRVKAGLVSLVVGLGFGLFFSAGYLVGGAEGFVRDPDLVSVNEAWNHFVNDYVEKAGIDPQRRPGTLALNEWFELCRRVEERC